MTLGRLNRSEVAPGLLLGEGVELGEEVSIGGNVVIHAGVRIGAGCRIGDHAQLREGVEVGAGATIGALSSIDPGVRLGERVSVQTGVYVAAGSVLEDDVFLGPGVVTTNDNAMGRHTPEEPLRGTRFRRACRVGGGSVICPGLELGEECFVAAGAVVIRDVPARAVVMGVPAREVRTVPDADLLEQWR